MEKVKVGIFGARRGAELVRILALIPNADFVAICGRAATTGRVVTRAKEYGFTVTAYEDFDSFIQHDMDAVILANYAHEHAPYAIQAMKAGKHVLSECFACANMKEAVELVEAVEETGKVYNLLERFCYNAAILNMKKSYQADEIGNALSMYGTYTHNVAGLWPSATRGDRNHWRNQMASTSYTTHAVGPALFVTGHRPVTVIGVESAQSAAMKNLGYPAGAAGYIIAKMDNGGVLNAGCEFLGGHGTACCLMGERGTLEFGRRSYDGLSKLALPTAVTSRQMFEFVNDKSPELDGIPRQVHADDFICVSRWVRQIMGEEVETVDVYMGVEMSILGLLAFKSIVNGSIPVTVPNLRNKDERDAYREDTFCMFKEIGGNMYTPSNAAQEDTTEIPDEVYGRVKALCEE